MRHSTALFRLLCALAFCVLAGSQARADVPHAPQNLAASAQWQKLGTSLWTKVIYLTWQLNPDSTRLPDYFTVYSAEGEKQDYTGFEEYERFYLRRNDTNGYWPGGIAVAYRGPGTFSFYVDATNGDGTGDPSNIATIELPDTVSLFFTDYPKAHIDNAVSAVAAVNEPYMYQVGATTWSSGTIKYNLAPFQSPLPSGLAIDEDTGVLTWTPAEKGLYYFRIQATMPEYPGLVLEAVASILVRQCAPGTTWITGTVVDQNGDPVTFGVVTAMPALLQDSIAGINYTGEISGNGFFSLSVDEGSYIIVVDGNGFAAEYYEDATTRETATPVAVECGETTDIDMAVKRLISYTVSGQVTDQDDNGIGNVLVTFRGYNPELPEEVRRLRPQYFNTTTDVNGNYSLLLPDYLVYIAAAYSSDTAVINNNYVITTQVQFFDHVGAVAEAEEIVLTDDRSGINFQFGHNHNFQNSISGRVRLVSSVGVPSYVTAYRVNGNSNFYISTLTESNGEYMIANLQPGQYVVYAAPYYGNIAPGYYHEDELVTSSWDDATRIVLGAQTDATNIDVVVGEVDSSAFGGGGLNGSVRGSGGAIGKVDGEVQNSTPINGALVTLIDAEGDVTRYNFSNNAGAFSLSNLPAGTYKLVVDKIGFTPYKTTIKIAESGPVNLDVTLQPEVTTGVGETTGNSAMARVYPNPASNNTMLSFRAAAGMARISVVHATGTEVLSLQKNTTDGDNAFLLDTRQLSSGAYFVRITAGDAQYTLPLQIVR